MKINTSWMTEALDMLGLYDRYTRDWVRSEFHEKATKGDIVRESSRITVNGEAEFFIYKTSLRNMYCVWEFNERRSRVFVLAVSSEQPRNRKEIEAMSHQSHLGFVKLMHSWKRCKECKNN